MESILEVQKISAGYQNRVILHDISTQIVKGEKVLLIGPNGSGKSTLLKVIAGTLKVIEGHVYFKDKEISQVPDYKRVNMGIGYLVQTRNIFPGLSIEENLQLSYWQVKGDYQKRKE